MLKVEDFVYLHITSINQRKPVSKMKGWGDPMLFFFFFSWVILPTYTNLWYSLFSKPAPWSMTAKNASLLSHSECFLHSHTLVVLLGHESFTTKRGEQKQEKSYCHSTYNIKNRKYLYHWVFLWQNWMIRCHWLVLGMWKWHISALYT